MKLIMENWRKYLQEGGNIFAGTDDIPREFIEPTLNKYYEELGRLFPQHAGVFDSFEPVGSVGKKDVSGDIDLALDLKVMFGDGEINADELESWNVDADAWRETFLKYKKRARTATDAQLGWRAFLTEIANHINANSNLIEADLKKIRPGNLFTSFPQFNEAGEQQEIGIQIDWMVGNLEWLTFSYFSDVVPKDEEYIKGLHRTQLLLSLFLVKDHSFSHTAGVTDKATGEIVASTPKEARKLLGGLYSVKVNPSNLKNFSSIYNWMTNNLSEEDKNRAIDAYLKILNFTKSTKVEDEETGEMVHCGYIPRVLEDYWIENKERLNLTGQYICRQTNPKIADASNIVEEERSGETVENQALTLDENENETVSETIRKVGSKWCLYSKSKTNGKRKKLGCYSSKKGAQDREKQVQYFKHAK